MVNTSYLLLAISTAVVYFSYVLLSNWRFKKYKDFPQLPSSLLIGHLPRIASGFKRLGDSRRHIGTTLVAFFGYKALIAYHRLHLRGYGRGGRTSGALTCGYTARELSIACHLLPYRRRTDLEGVQGFPMECEQITDHL